MKLNYKILLSGIGSIQAFLRAESISAKEALNVSLFSLDILAAYKLEEIVAPKEILSCLADYSEVFLTNTPSADFIKSVIKNYPQKPPSIQRDISESNCTEELFKYGIIFNENTTDSFAIKPCEELVLSLSSRDLFKSIFWVHAALSAKRELSETEALSIKQAVNYINITAESMADAKLKWWLKMANLVPHRERI
ncbi:MULTISPECIES: hypothetical protein [Pseudomonas]|uniref:hypothetical protein n=1 Tax=Pseudomonas TaxID=286 RepID=UPI0018E6FD2D|nr:MULTISPECIES: hypothetical protein [Pseudomonas]MBJ2227218.1 hypothetical protein [Pseudomonas sp. MF7451]MBW9237012.1 hypothetical protein [Pseudomonas carnis]MCO7038000.1 hypothetical protein [Pseudomonas carnis]MDH0798067.1 hypothetical protein [Pseudomonas carnis]